MFSRVVSPDMISSLSIKVVCLAELYFSENIGFICFQKVLLSVILCRSRICIVKVLKSDLIRVIIILWCSDKPVSIMTILKTFVIICQDCACVCVHVCMFFVVVFLYIFVQGR